MYKYYYYIDAEAQKTGEKAVYLAYFQPEAIVDKLPVSISY